MSAKVRERYSKTVPVDVYNTDLLFVIGGTPQEAALELCDLLGLPDEERRRAVDSVGRPGLGMTIIPPNRRSFAIWLPESPVSPGQIGTVAHEALHGAAYLMADAGVEWTVHDSDSGKWVNDEAFCYLVGYLVREFMVFAGQVRERQRKAKLRRK